MLKEIGIFTTVVIVIASAESKISWDSIGGISHFKRLNVWHEETPRLSLEWKDKEDVYYSDYKLQKEYEKDLVGNSTPLTLQGSARYYMRDFDPDPTRDDINSKVSLGVQYRFLKGGLLSKSRKISTISRQLLQDSLLWVKKSEKEQYQQWRYQVASVANSRTYELQKRYTDFLKQYVAVVKKHYFNKKTTKERYEEISQLYHESRLLVELLESEKRVTSLALPLFYLKSSLSAVDTTTTDSLSFNTKTYGEMISLNASVAAEFYPRYDEAQGNLVAALQVSLPVAAIKKSNKSHENRVAHYASQISSRDIMERKEHFKRALVAYQEAASDFARISARIEKRKSAVEKEYFNITHFESTPDFLTLYRKIDVYYRSLFDHIEVKEKMLLKLITIAELHRSRDIMDIAESRTSKAAFTEMVRSGNRSLYVWKRAFDDTPPQFLIQFCVLRNIKRIYVSASRYTENSPAIKVLKSAGLVIIPLYSENSWSLTHKHERALERISALPDETQEIHLDIEPHALDNWREDEYQKLKEYVLLLSKIRKGFKGNISVSIPAIYPIEMYPEIYKYVDRVEFMIYGKSSSQTVQKLKQLYSSSIPTSLAVRTTDFENELAMEAFIEKVIAHGITNITLFDFGSYRELVTK